MWSRMLHYFTSTENFNYLTWHCTVSYVALFHQICGSVYLNLTNIFSGLLFLPLTVPMPTTVCSIYLPLTVTYAYLWLSCMSTFDCPICLPLTVPYAHLWLSCMPIFDCPTCLPLPLAVPYAYLWTSCMLTFDCLVCLPLTVLYAHLWLSRMPTFVWSLSLHLSDMEVLINC